MHLFEALAEPDEILEVAMIARRPPSRSKELGALATEQNAV
jgi:hypothetical protein